MGVDPQTVLTGGLYLAAIALMTVRMLYQYRRRPSFSVLSWQASILVVVLLAMLVSWAFSPLSRVLNYVTVALLAFDCFVVTPSDRTMAEDAPRTRLAFALLILLFILLMGASRSVVAPLIFRNLAGQF